MLVVDPSSECDICFEPYGSKTPHSVPCGHVFCKECLDDLHDCPICREPFATEQVTKLHVDRQSGQPSNEINFLRRLILSMYDNSSSEKFSDIMEEAFAWLESQPPDSNELLRSAWVVFSAYPVSKEKNGSDETFLELCRQLHESDRAYQAAKAEWDIKIAVAETEVSALRTENDRLYHNFDQKLAASEAEITGLRDEIAQLRKCRDSYTAPPTLVLLLRFLALLPFLSLLYFGYTSALEYRVRGSVRSKTDVPANYVNIIEQPVVTAGTSPWQESVSESTPQAHTYSSG